MMNFVLTKFDESWDTLKNLVEKMDRLKRKLEGLNARKEDTESSASTQLRPRKKLKKEVELWFRNVERINNEIQVLQQKLGEGDAISRGFLKRDVLKKIQEVEELFQQGKFHEGLVVADPGWIGQTLSTTTVFGGAAKTCMEEIWAYLMDVDVQKIGVWGMGGVGKTTIMKLIHNQLLKEANKFNIVIWVTLSKEMNISKMQKRIARAMEETLDEDEDDESIRAEMIFEMLARKGKFVLILDDLWDKLSLEDVGIPEHSNGSKVLVTTRLLDVCDYLDCRKVKVPTLSKPDAWELFLKNVGHDVLNHPNLLPIVQSVAEECDGLPLAIVTISSSMKGVCNIHEWRNAFRELTSHVKCVNMIEEKLFRQLRFSYDRLEDEKMKHCILCCALYPEDFEIDTKELIGLWIAEGLVEEMDSMEIEIDKGRSILNTLKNSCMIETVIDEYSTVENKVKLHDVVRDMALRITSVRPRFLVRAGMQLKRIPDVQYWHKDLKNASLMGNRRLQIPSRMPPLIRLTTLLLSNCCITSIPKCFFQQMRRLKILDLSDNSMRSLPNSISNLRFLTTLLLNDCEELEKVPPFSQLTALKKLDLRKTKIKDIPAGMERLENLKYLDLSLTRITNICDGLLATFISLQHLSIYNYDKIVVGGEIGGLRKLEFFEGRFGDLKELNRYYAQLLDARRRWPREYRIYVGPGSEVEDEDEDEYDNHDSEQFIEVEGCKICSIDGIKIPYDVDDLSFVNCNVNLCEEAKEFFSWCIIPVPFNNMFSSLSTIHTWNCANIKKLFLPNWLLNNLQNLI